MQLHVLTINQEFRDSKPNTQGCKSSLLEDPPGESSEWPEESLPNIALIRPIRLQHQDPMKYFGCPRWMSGRLYFK